MPLHTPTITAPHLPRTGRLAAVTVALVVGAGAVVLATSDPTPQVRVAPAGAATVVPDLGLEVNKAASMQALSRHSPRSAPSASRSSTTSSQQGPEPGCTMNDVVGQDPPASA